MYCKYYNNGVTIQKVKEQEILLLMTLLTYSHTTTSTASHMFKRLESPAIVQIVNNVTTALLKHSMRV